MIRHYVLRILLPVGRGSDAALKIVIFVFQQAFQYVKDQSIVQSRPRTKPKKELLILRYPNYFWSVKVGLDFP